MTASGRRYRRLSEEGRERAERRRPRATNRAQSEVIGAILLFAVLIALIVLIQVAAVPGWNQQIEYEHNQRVQNDLGKLVDSTYRVAATGRTESASIESGTQYPTRPFLLNPPSPTGTLETVDEGEVSLQNVRALDPEADDFWQTNPGPYEQQGLVYEPGYNEFQNAPGTLFDGTTRYNRQPDGTTVLLGGGDVVSGNRVTVITVAGEHSLTTAGTDVVSLQPVSAPMRTVSVTSRTADPLVVTLDTRLAQGQWGNRLDAELVSRGGHVTDWHCTGSVPDASCETLTIELEPGVTYQLRMAQVGIDTGASSSAAAYVTRVGSGERRIAGGDTEELTVEVRDRFNNPVGGVPVDFAVSGVGSLSDTQVTTDESGQASVTYGATTNGSASVVATAVVANGDQPYERVTFDIENREPVNPTTDLGSNINPGYEGSVVLLEDFLEGSNNCRAGDAAQECVAVLTFENTGDETRTIKEVRVNVYVASQPGQGSRERPESVEVIEGLNSSGVFTVRGDFEDVTGEFSAIPSNGETTLRFTFYADEAGTQPYGAANGDLFVVTILYGDGSSAIYFVAPIKE